MSEAPFRTIPEYPGEVSAPAVTARMLDGLGFRFHWATEGLKGEEFETRVCDEGSSIGQIIGHVWGLANWMHLHLTGEEVERPESVWALRNSALGVLSALREAVLSKSGGELEAVTIEGRPFWHFINGPIADALTHTGQINVLRRLAGNPPPRANVFLGLPPRAE